MEANRPSPAEPLLSWSVLAARLTLLGLLFVPAFLAQRYLPEPPEDPEPVAEAEHPKELVRIYSILRAHRPEVGETQAWTISEAIFHESSAYGFDPLLVSALIDVESEFQHQAVSPAGARGVMQLLPHVARALMKRLSRLGDGRAHREFRAEHLDDPVLNIKLGVYYLHDLRRSFRSLKLALAAYNLGPTEMRYRLENSVEFPEEFAAAVLSRYEKLKRIKPPEL
ncbi:MAG TPA: lytic transglycosylase domain-containing protein [candidate division Zixibacteria bacterium]|nr:lytic transglycosylase domain-containing protein [candidate division Zixibacteria bacterium]